MRHRTACLLTALLGVAPLSAPAGTGAWDQFRGPDGAGVAPASRPPVRLGADCLAWKTPIPPGLSSPVLSRGRVFLTALEKGRLATLALDAASGRVVWRQEAPDVPLEKVHASGSPAAPTPHADDGRVYVYFGSFGLLCYDHAGREPWRVSLPAPQSLYGTAASPVGHGENLILVLDDEANLPGSKLSRSRLLAVRKASGERVWETPRPLQRSGWSTPTVWSHAGGQDLVVLGGGRACGYDPLTGAEKWYVTGFSRETIARPVAGGGRVFVSAAQLGGVADEQPDPQPFWEAVLKFDADGDGRLARGEMTAGFTFPLRPELPVGHPGFGIPLAADPGKRKEQQAGIFAGTDRNKDGYWDREEFVASMSSRRGRPMLVAIRPGGRGDVTATHVDWQLHRGVPEIPSPLFHRDRLYLVRNGGILTAVDAADGTILYSERVGGSGQYSASPVLADGHLYLISNRGEMSVVKEGDAFRGVHRHDLGEPAFVTPALDADTIYVRTEKHLCAFRAKP